MHLRCNVRCERLIMLIHLHYFVREVYYTDVKHTLIPKMFPEAAPWTLVCNSIGKSASATGWR